MLTQSRLKDLFLESGFTPLKRLGENYLIDGNIRDKIIRSAALSKDDDVLEIGPGFGALTFDLACAAKEVMAVEIDKKASAILTGLAGKKYPNLRIINRDILKFDIEDMFHGRRAKVVGNLPYYITTPVLEYLIDNRRFVESAIIMIQKEVARRLLAGPGTKDYASISCFVNYFMKPEYIYTVKRTAFFPSPKVDSCILKLTIQEKPPVEVADEEKFFRIIRGSFNQRRKSILNSISREAVLNIPKDKLSVILKKANVDPLARPETLSLSDFALISNLTKHYGCGKLYPNQKGS